MASRHAVLRVSRSASSITAPPPTSSAAAKAKSAASQSTSRVNCIAMSGEIRIAAIVAHIAIRHLTPARDGMNRGYSYKGRARLQLILRAIARYYRALTERPAFREHVMVSYEELRAV